MLCGPSWTVNVKSTRVWSALGAQRDTDRGRGKAAVEVFEHQRVARLDDARFEVGVAGRNLHERAQLVDGDGRRPHDPDLAEHRTRALDDDDRGPHVPLGRTLRGALGGARRIGLVDPRPDLDGGKAALPVVRLDRGHAGAERGLEEELARLEGDERGQLRHRHGLRAGDLGRRRDAILPPARHRKDDRQRRGRGLAPDRDIRLPVALLTQVVLDPRFGILEQVLVDRPFALERRQFLEPIGGQRLASLEIEAHRHRQARGDADDEVDGPAILRRDRLQRSLGLVVAPVLQALHVGVEAFLNARPEIDGPGFGAELAQEGLTRDERVALDGDLADDRPRPGVDGERQPRAVGVVLDLGRGLHCRAQKPMVRVQLLQRPDRRVDAPDRRRGAVALDDRARAAALPTIRACP